MEVASIEFRLLGPVEAMVNGAVAPLGGRRQRVLLALLLVERGRPVTTHALADQLWQGCPPRGFQTTLRSYVSRLRRVLGESAVISGARSTYSLQTAPETVDISRFERLTQDGNEALARGAVGRAADRFVEALSLWRGRALEGVADEGALRLEAERLEELRLLAVEQRIEADLALGRARELVDELEALVREHPFRERLWRQLMLALYRAERQSEALEAYQRLRATLVDELGLEPGTQLRELEQAILRQEVPPLEPPGRPHNLPAAVTSFVGRVAELADVASLLAQSRLVTLTGVGGVGKTRLAIEVATRAIEQCPDGVVFCDLAALAEPALVAQSVARVLDLREQAQVDTVDALIAHLRDAGLLLLLDNCEHLRDACAQLAKTLLSACPRLRILATSRGSLGVVGEVDYSVPPLALAQSLTLSPSSDNPDDLRSSEAVALFLARARAARPRLAVDATAMAAATRICAELDGLPLAIELAAARAKALSLEEIAERLADRFRFLVSWRRLAPVRHQTLKEAMDWSYALLPEEERTLLTRLSVFADGFTLAAVAGVCLDGDEPRALELVSRLVDASLVLATERGGAMRYRLLETVRQYAAGRLEERGETNELRGRHADDVLAFAEGSWSIQVAALDRWVETMDRERGNLRAALACSRDAGERERLLRLARAVWRFWWISGDLSEGRAWLDAAIEAGVDLDPALRAEAHEGAAGLAWAQGDMDRARDHAEVALALFAAAGDRRGQHGALIVLGHVALDRGELGPAEAMFERSLELAESLAQPAYVAVSTHNLGSVALAGADLDGAARRYDLARRLYRADGDDYGVALSELYQAVVAAEAARYEEAAGLLRTALPVFRRMGFLQYAAQCVDVIAPVARARGHAWDAARLLASATALRERTGNAPFAGARLHQREVTATCSQLGEPRFAAAWAEGLAIAQNEALDLAEATVAG